MGNSTVEWLASELQKSPQTFLEELRAAGIEKESVKDHLSEDDKTQLLAHVHRMHGLSEETRPSDGTRPRRTLTLTKEQWRSLQSWQAQTLRARAQKLRLYGLLAHWPAIQHEPWVAQMVRWEEDERASRSLRRRIKNAHLGSFKVLSDFDWSWPSRCDCGAIEELMALGFMKDATNVVFTGPNGVGKSTLAKNVAQQALVHGHKVLFTTAGEMLGELAAFDSASTLRRRMRRYVELDLLVIDEVGYRSYSNREADLLFEVISRRYKNNSTIVTSNRPLSEWHDVFPDAACTSSLVDRLAHLAEVISIEGESYVMKEARELADEISH